MRSEDQAVSVVMPVRNAMPFLDEAIASILGQTHRNFEFLIGDDGSTDGSTEYIEKWAARDARIRIIRNDGTGLGPSGSSNWVVRNATHQWIARMDADDISRPDRLHRQLLALLEHPDAVVIGSLFEIIDSAGKQVFGVNRRMLRNIQNDFPVAHGSIMFQRDAFERAGGYRVACDYWEDSDLLLRMMRQGKAILLPEAVFQYRLSATSSRLMADEIRVTRAMDLGLRCMAAHRARGDYEDILEEESRLGPPAALTPMAVTHFASVQLWRGDVRTIRSFYARWQTKIPWDRKGVSIRLFEYWAVLSPASLRLLLKLRARYNDWRARNIVGRDEILVWTGETKGWQKTRLTTAGDDPAAHGKPAEARPATSGDFVERLA